MKVKISEHPKDVFAWYKGFPGREIEADSITPEGFAMISKAQICELFGHDIFTQGGIRHVIPAHDYERVPEGRGYIRIKDSVYNINYKHLRGQEFSVGGCIDITLPVCIKHEDKYFNVQAGDYSYSTKPTVKKRSTLLKQMFDDSKARCEIDLQAGTLKAYDDKGNEIFRGNSKGITIKIDDQPVNILEYQRRIELTNQMMAQAFNPLADTQKWSMKLSNAEEIQLSENSKKVYTDITTKINPGKIENKTMIVPKIPDEISADVVRVVEMMEKYKDKGFVCLVFGGKDTKPLTERVRKAYVDFAAEMAHHKFNDTLYLIEKKGDFRLLTSSIDEIVQKSKMLNLPVVNEVKVKYDFDTHEEWLQKACQSRLDELYGYEKEYIRLGKQTPNCLLDAITDIKIHLFESVVKNKGDNGK